MNSAIAHSEEVFVVDLNGMNDDGIATREADLQTFSRYDLKLDIYSFQYELMKIYKKTNQKMMIPDIFRIICCNIVHCL